MSNFYLPSDIWESTDRNQSACEEIPLSLHCNHPQQPHEIIKACNISHLSKKPNQNVLFSKLLQVNIGNQQHRLRDPYELHDWLINSGEQNKQCNIPIAKSLRLSRPAFREKTLVFWVKCKHCKDSAPEVGYIYWDKVTAPGDGCGFRLKLFASYKKGDTLLASFSLPVSNIEAFRENIKGILYKGAHTNKNDVEGSSEEKLEQYAKTVPSDDCERFKNRWIAGTKFDLFFSYPDPLSPRHKHEPHFSVLQFLIEHLEDLRNDDLKPQFEGMREQCADKCLLFVGRLWSTLMQLNHANANQRNQNLAGSLMILLDKAKSLIENSELFLWSTHSKIFLADCGKLNSVPLNGYSEIKSRLVAMLNGLQRKVNPIRASDEVYADLFIFDALKLRSLEIEGKWTREALLGMERLHSLENEVYYIHPALFSDTILLRYNATNTATLEIVIHDMLRGSIRFAYSRRHLDALRIGSYNDRNDTLDEVWYKIYRCIHWKQLVLGDDQLRALDELRKANSPAELISLPLTISVHRLLKLDLDVEFLDKVFPNFKELNKKRDLTGLNDLFEAFYSKPDPPDTDSIKCLDTNFLSALKTCSITKASSLPQPGSRKQRFIEIHAKLDSDNTTLRRISLKTPGNYLQLQLSRAGLLQFAASEYNDYTIRVVCGSTLHGGVRNELPGAPWAHRAPCHEHLTEVYRDILGAKKVQTKKKGPGPPGYFEIGPLDTDDWRAIQNSERWYTSVHKIYLQKNYSTKHIETSSCTFDDDHSIRNRSRQPNRTQVRAPEYGPNRLPSNNVPRGSNNHVLYHQNPTNRTDSSDWRRRND